jgi:hypothetical protein
VLIPVPHPCAVGMNGHLPPIPRPFHVANVVTRSSSQRSTLTRILFKFMQMTSQLMAGSQLDAILMNLLAAHLHMVSLSDPIETMSDVREEF